MVSCTFWIAGLIMFPVIVPPSADNLPGDLPSDFKTTTGKSTDEITVQADKNTAIFAIKSKSGIGKGTIERVTASWPKKVAIRLHLKGLESLRISNGEVTIGAAVSSQTGHAVRVHLLVNGKEGPNLDKKSPYYLEIQMKDGKGKPVPSIPLKDGYLEVSLPAALLGPHANLLKVEWIDFYR